MTTVSCSLARSVTIWALALLATVLLVPGCGDSDSANPVNAHYLNPPPVYGLTFVNEEAQIIGTIGLPTGTLNAYPNPFNPSMTINVDLESSGPVWMWVTPVKVQGIELTRLLHGLGCGLADPPGAPIEYLVNGTVFPSGAISVHWEAGNLPNGIYRIYLLSSELFTWKDALLLRNHEWRPGDPLPF